MFRPVFCSGILTIALLNLAPVCLAVPVESVPNPRRIDGGWVTDMANILAPATEVELNRQISILEASNSNEIAVVTVPDIAPATNVKAFATQLFNTWGIGKRDKNNGVLFLISKADRRVEIITGKGLTTLLPDSQVSAILRQNVTPKFKQRQFDAGVLAGTNSLINHIHRDRFATPQAGQPSSNQKQSAISALATTPPTRPRKAQPNFSDVKLQPSQPEAIAESNPVQTFMVAVLGGLGISAASLSGIVLYRRLNRVLLAPEGESRVEKSAITSREQFHCEICKRRMQQLTAGELSLFLSQPQQTAQQLGSVVYEGWRCQPCQPSLYGRGFHLRALVMDTEQFSQCPTCNELTATHHSIVVQQPTWNREGKLQLTHQCQCCSNQWQTEAAIACLPLPQDAVTLEPIGRSRVNNFRFFHQAESERPTHCSRCHYPMQQVSAEKLKSRLQKPERVAQYLGSVSFMGWHCPTCYPNADADIHVRAYVLSSHYHYCPDCQELTVEQTSTTVQPATSHSQGRQQITRWCHCCSFMNERWETIPRLASNNSDWASNSSWSSDDSSSSSWSSNDSSNNNWSCTDSSSSSWSSSDNSSSWSSSDNSSSSWSSSDSSSSSSDFGGGSSSSSGSGDSW